MFSIRGARHHVPMTSNSEEVTQTRQDLSEDESDSDGDEGQQQWLVNTRAKRTTAGNRLHVLLQQEDIDDDLELLFAEDEDDAGFSDVEAGQSDEQMDSSSDNEDQGPAAGDELEGEKELQKAVRTEQAKKKKKRRQIPGIVKRRAQDSTQEGAPPKKRSERTSWLPAANDAPIRASSRDTTRQSKQELQLQMMDREIKRLKQLANMEKAAAAKAAKEKPPLTQEDRLREAARVEKANAKSLSRWERAEEEREQEQKQRLANLHNRHMEGPVLTYWSGMATYIGGKLHKLGKIDLDAKEKPATKKRKVEEVDDSKSHQPTQNEVNLMSSSVPDGNTVQQATTPESIEKVPSAALSTPNSKMSKEPCIIIPRVSPAHPPQKPASSCLAPPPGLPLLAPPHQFLVPPPLNVSSPLPLPPFGYYKTYSQQYHQYPSPFYQTHVPPYSSSTPPAPAPAPAPAVERCLRTSLIFSNFAESAIKSRETQLRILLPFATTCPARFTKLPRTRTGNKDNSCVITGFPARYRDPKTGLPYCNLFAYQEIQKLQRGEILWSDLASVYVGKGSIGAALGVPDRFKGLEDIKHPIQKE
ncbi:hypothetical protein K3495_g12085 [Podosphaera aphanis]|nr:hypothetical protein K3495_g12085 [Podosphaera aphanis]